MIIDKVSKHPRISLLNSRKEYVWQYKLDNDKLQENVEKLLETEPFCYIDLKHKGVTVKRDKVYIDEDGYVCFDEEKLVGNA